MQRLHNARGFTLIELMATLALLAIIALIAVPTIGNIIQNSGTKAEAASIDMIEHAGGVAEVAGLVYDYDGYERYSVKGLIEEGFLDLDPNDPLAQGGAYVQKVGKGNTYVYYGSGSQPDYSNEAVENTVDSDVFEIVKATPPDGRFVVGDAVDYSVTVKNISSDEAWLEVTTGFMDDNDDYYEHWDMSEAIAPGATYTLDITWDSSEAAGNLFYDTYFNIYDGGSQSVGTIGFVDTFYMADSNDWSYFTEKDWFLQDRSIGGIGQLVKERIDLNDRNITVELPADSYDSGQVRSHNMYGFGSYEARMKVPTGDANLTGFFMYAPEDTEHEIDMEILHYEGRWQLWMTIHNINHVTYKDGMYDEPGEVFKEKIDLDFDPSAGFHDYRIDFYPDHVAFQVDGKEVAKWHERFDFSKMYVFSGTFSTHWLSGEQFDHDRSMETQWIRHGYFK